MFMTLKQWLKEWRKTPVSSKRRKLLGVSPLALESLEERLVPSGPGNSSLQAVIQGLPASDEFNQGTTVTVQAAVSGAVGLPQYSWSLLEGSTSIASGSGAAFTFTPNASGSYEISLAVTDSSGATAQAQQALVVDAGGLQQGGFETPFVGTGSSAYQYDPSGSMWTFTGASGLTGNGSAFTSGNANAPQGTQVAFLQGTGSFSQSASLDAGAYTLSFAAAQRGNYQASSQTFRVLVDGQAVGSFTPSGTDYGTYTTSTFTISTGTHAVEFQALDPNSGDNTAFVDEVQLNMVPPPPPPTNGLQQGTFSTPNEGTGSSAYQYDPSGSAWTFTGLAGLAGNGSAFTSGNPTAPAGTQVAFLQGTGSFSQTASLSAGTYTLSFAAAQRGNYQASSQTIEVLVDGASVGTFTPSGASYTAYTTNTFTLTAGTHTIEFLGLDPKGGDNTAFVDEVQLNTVPPPPSPPPPTNGLQQGTFSTPNEGTGSSAYQYDPSGSAWTFTGASGLTGNGSAFTSGNPNVPAGTQAAFLQGTGSFSQTTSLSAGTYTLSFVAAQRGNYQSSSQTIEVLVDGTSVGTFTPSGASYTAYTTNAFTLAAGTHTIEFLGLDPNGGDNTVFVDEVQLNTVSSPTPLQASITGAPASGQSNAGAALTLSAQVSGGAAGSDGYSWVATESGQTIATGNTAAFAFTPANPGTVQVALTVTDSSGATAAASQSVQVLDVAPTVTISGPTSGQTGQSLSFTASASDISPADNTAGYSYSWNFGDGATATTATASHIYSAAGAYTVTVTATDTNGGQGSTTSSINIVVPAPVANAGPNESAPEGSAVTFAGSVSNGTSPLTYSWSFGDGGTASGSLTPSHTYEQAGTYTATLTVTDALGRTSQSSDTVTVGLVAPTVSIGGPYSGTANTAITFNGSATDPSTYDTQAGFTYKWSFGDGSTATTASASHTYTSGGTYTVTLTATDKEGAVGTSSTTVTVNAPAPVANAGPNESGPEGSAITFSGSESGGTSPLTYSWSFGDGGSSSGSLTPSHTYEEAGTYTATLTVTDAQGRTSQSSDTVTVSLVAPTVTIGGPYSGTANTAIAFSGTATDPSTYDTQAGFTYSWNFGDGSTATTASASHTYASAGTYTVTLTATDKEGAVGTSSTTVTVNAPAPVANAGPNESAPEGTAITFSGSESGGTSPLTYSWTFGDGGSSSGSLTPSHTYEEAGTYTATLTVTDALGRTSKSSDTVTVGLVAPTVSIGGPYMGSANVAIAFSGSATDPSTYDTQAGFTYQWSFGDGGTAATASASHTYASGGIYTVTLSVTDKEGSVSTSSTIVSVGSQTSSTVFPNNQTPPALAAPTGPVVTVSTVAQLQSAVSNLQSGQTIMIEPGTYDLTGTLVVPQNLTNIAIRGATGKASDVVIQGDAVLDTSAPYTGSDIWGSGSGISGTIQYGIWLGDVQGVTIADMTIKDFVYDAIILNAGVQSPLIHDVTMLDTGEQLLKSNPNGNPDTGSGGVNNGIVEYCTIGYSTAAPNSYTNGIDIHAGQNWIIRNNVFENIYTTNPGTSIGMGSLVGPAVLIWDQSANCTTEDNAFINCVQEIAYGYVAPTTVTDDNTGGLIANNFIYRNGTQPGAAGISVWNSPNTVVADNTIILNGSYANAIEYRYSTTTGVQILYNLTDSAIALRDGASGTVTGNVTDAQSSWFANESIGNLNLTSAATPAIGHGGVVAGVTTDYNGQPRPTTSAPDVGAAQYIAAAVAPTVTEVTPATGATEVVIGTTVTVTFSEAINPATVTSSTVQLLGPSGSAVPATVSFNSTTDVATLTPTSALATDSTFEVLVHGGSTGAIIENTSGTALAANFTSTFTTDSPPTANAGPNESGPEGSAITFAGSVTGGVGTLTYSWTFGDGGTSSGSLAPSHTYEQAGTYTATLTVTDSLGQTSQSSDTVTVSLVAPTVSIGGPYSGSPGTAISFSGSATDPSTYDTQAGFTYSWNFGDGSTATTASASHAYTSAGTYTVTLTATDKEGAIGSSSTTVTVTASPPPPAPVANAGLNESGAEGSAITFSGSVSGGASPLTYSWTFGDGGTTTGSLMPSHVYEQAGTYVATLTVTDALGRTSQSSDTVTVSLVDPTVNIGGPYSGSPGTAISFSGSATDPSTYDTQAGFTYSWNFGDGSTATTASASHTYASAGTYNVTLSVTDAEGAVGTSSTTVTVSTSAVPNEPLLYSSNVQYVGAFRVPAVPDPFYPGNYTFSYSGTALAYNPADNSLFLVGGAPYYQGISEISIPQTIVNSSNLNSLSTATVLQGPVQVLNELPNNPPVPDSSGGLDIGGLMVDNGQLIGTAYTYYDTDGQAIYSHFTMSSLNLSTATVGGLYQVGNLGAGVVAGYMTPIPSEWQAALGAPDLTGESDIPIISRTSSGPAAFGFNPSNLGSGVTPDIPYVYYPSSNPLAPYEGPANPLQNGNTTIAGAVFVPGTSTILYFGVTGTNYEGYGQSSAWGDTVTGGKGPKSLNGQYSLQVWAYNANDFLAVKEGTLQPWQVQPYDVWNFTVPDNTYTVGGVAYNPSTGQLYMSMLEADDEQAYTYLPLIEVFQVNVPSGTPALAAPQIGTMAVTPSITPDPSARDSQGDTIPQTYGTYPGPVNPGDAVVLTAENVFAINSGASIQQVAFYISANNSNAPFSTSNDTLLGYGTGAQNLPNGSSSNWTLTISTAGLAPGTYTVFAQAVDSDGLFSNPIATTLTIS